MKRSVMVKIMESHKTSMDELLTIMEKEGMLPPRNPNATFEEQITRRGNGQSGLNFWENE